jgi:hypothetical protein
LLTCQASASATAQLHCYTAATAMRIGGSPFALSASLTLLVYLFIYLFTFFFFLCFFLIPSISFFISPPPLFNHSLIHSQWKHPEYVLFQDTWRNDLPELALIVLAKTKMSVAHMLSPPTTYKYNPV